MVTYFVTSGRCTRRIQSTLKRVLLVNPKSILYLGHLYNFHRWRGEKLQSQGTPHLLQKQSDVSKGNCFVVGSLEVWGSFLLVKFVHVSYYHGLSPCAVKMETLGTATTPGDTSTWEGAALLMERMATQNLCRLWDLWLSNNLRYMKVLFFELLWCIYWKTSL